MDPNTEILKKQLMVGQFVNAVGCSQDEATQILTSSRWQFEVSLICLNDTMANLRFILVQTMNFLLNWLHIL